jgi:hypothetical protein
MKPQEEKIQGLYLQKRNNRWKWMAGATAASAAAATASQANTITINLVNNYISAANGNHLNADLTGDGHPDLTIANTYIYRGATYRAAVTLNGVRAYDRQQTEAFGTTFHFLNAFMQLGSRFAHFASTRSGYVHHSSGTRSLMGSIPIFFKDLHINGGAPTEGFLEVTVSPFDIQLDSFTYNDPSFHAANATAVPDQGSSLALLAMGAGGVLALRHRRKTANN